MINISEIIRDYGYDTMDGWDKDYELILMDFGSIFSQVLDGSGYYAYRNPTKGEKNINISKIGVVGSTKKYRIMWVYLINGDTNVDMGINRELFNHISKIIELPEPREVKPGRYKTEWVITIDLPTALKVCAVFANKEFSE